MKKCKCILTDFAYGLIIGFVTAVIICMTIFGLIYVNHKTKERLEYAERQIEIEVLREDIINRDVVDILDTIPGVRNASDGAAAEFERRRDEILHGFRNRNTD